jgi:GH24 family phage-related lysozyme (muramidase)
MSDKSKAALISYWFNYPAGFKDTTNFMKLWRSGRYWDAINEVDAGINDAANPGLRTRRLKE